MSWKTLPTTRIINKDPELDLRSLGEIVYEGEKRFVENTMDAVKQYIKELGMKGEPA